MSIGPPKMWGGPIERTGLKKSPNFRNLKQNEGFSLFTSKLKTPVSHSAFGIRVRNGTLNCCSLLLEFLRNHGCCQNELNSPSVHFLEIQSLQLLCFSFDCFAIFARHFTLSSSVKNQFVMQLDFFFLPGVEFSVEDFDSPS